MPDLRALRRLRFPDARTTATQGAAVRTLAAATIVAAPVPAARLFGADTATAQRVTWLSRMMGVRDGVIGVGTLDALRRREDTTAWLLGAAVADGVDAVVLARALGQGRLRGVLPRAVVVVAAGSSAVHVLTALRLRRA